MSTTEHKIAVMQAYVAGKNIEWRIVAGGAWSIWDRGVLVSEPSWDWGRTDYRVAAEPIRYRRYVRDTRNHPGSPTVRMCNIAQCLTPADSDAVVRRTESLQGFVRWIDLEWLLP